MQQQTEQLSDGQRLNAAQIWAFLAKASIGRLATHDHAHNQSNLTPLFFVCEPPHIYFATQPGHKLSLLRRYPQGIGLQADEFDQASTTSVFVWGRYRDVPLGAEYAHATRLLAIKYGTGFWQQILDQASKALKAGPRAVLTTISQATTGCIQIERIGGRRWEHPL